MIFHDRLLCVPVVEGDSMDACLSKHFSEASGHMLFDVVSGNIELRGVEPIPPGDCDGVSRLIEHGVSAVLTRAVGRRIYEKLLSQGVSVWLTEAESVGEAVELWRSGELLPLLEEDLKVRGGECSGRKKQQRNGNLCPH